MPLGRRGWCWRGRGCRSRVRSSKRPGRRRPRRNRVCNSVARSGRAVLAGLDVLGEVVAQFLEEALAAGADLLVLQLGQVAEQLLLAGAEPGGGLDDNLDEFVAPP